MKAMMCAFAIAAIVPTASGTRLPRRAPNSLPLLLSAAARNFAVDAHAEGDGSAAVGNSALNNQTSRTVTCLSVDGNLAALGGVLIAGTPGSPGGFYLQYFVDLGPTSPNPSQPDWTSALYTGPPTVPWPASPISALPRTGPRRTRRSISRGRRRRRRAGRSEQLALDRARAAVAGRPLAPHLT